MKELCAAIKASDARALETLFRATRMKLVTYVASILRDEPGAHDIVQDVFADLWQMRARLDTSKSVEALLYRMCRNRAFTTVRNNKTRMNKHVEIRNSTTVVEDEVASVRIDALAIDSRLRQWLDELPERQREALLLCRLQDLSHREVADVMGVSPRTVNNHIIRALDTLRQRVREIEPTLIDE